MIDCGMSAEREQLLALSLTRKRGPKPNKGIGRGKAGHKFSMDPQEKRIKWATRGGKKRWAGMTSEERKAAMHLVRRGQRGCS